jgi:hypothetical protein
MVMQMQVDCFGPSHPKPIPSIPIATATSEARRGIPPLVIVCFLSHYSISNNLCAAGGGLLPPLVADYRTPLTADYRTPLVADYATENYRTVMDLRQTPQEMKPRMVRGTFHDPDALRWQIPDFCG